jgi:DNA-binding NarL/FixJ family response regulator
MRIGIAALIASSSEMVTVGQAGSGEEAIEQHALRKPDITLMDLRLPGISGVETIRRIRSTSPEARFIVLTTYEGDEDIHQAMEAGASGYLVKGLPQQALASAVRRVHAGGRYLPSPMSQMLASRTPDSSLSAREREVLELVAKGNFRGHCQVPRERDFDAPKCKRPNPSRGYGFAARFDSLVIQPTNGVGVPFLLAII